MIENPGYLGPNVDMSAARTLIVRVIADRAVEIYRQRFTKSPAITPGMEAQIGIPATEVQPKAK